MIAFKAIAITCFISVVLANAGQNQNQCDTGSLTCCEQTHNAAANPSVLGPVLGLLDPTGTVLGMIGVNCNPITGIGAGGTSCTKQTICCDHVDTKGLFAIGCSSGSIGL